MIGKGKCPACGEIVHKIQIDEIEASKPMDMNVVRCWAFLCQKCNTVLGVQAIPK